MKWKKKKVALGECVGDTWKTEVPRGWKENITRLGILVCIRMRIRAFLTNPRAKSWTSLDWTPNCRMLCDIEIRINGAIWDDRKKKNKMVSLYPTSDFENFFSWFVWLRWIRFCSIDWLLIDWWMDGWIDWCRLGEVQERGFEGITLRDLKRRATLGGAAIPHRDTYGLETCRTAFLRTLSLILFYSSESSTLSLFSRVVAMLSLISSRKKMPSMPWDHFKVFLWLACLLKLSLQRRLVLSHPFVSCVRLYVCISVVQFIIYIKGIAAFTGKHWANTIAYFAWNILAQDWVKNIKKGKRKTGHGINLNSFSNRGTWEYPHDLCV